MLKFAILLCLAGIMWDHFLNGAHFASMAGQLLWLVMGWSNRFAGHVVPT